MGYESELINPFDNHSVYMVFFSDIMSNKNHATEYVFYSKLVEQMICNDIDTLITTRGRANCNAIATGPPSILDTIDGRVSSGTGVHLTPTKKRRRVRGQLTNFLMQDWCSDCFGGKAFKTTYVCSECRDVDGCAKNLSFCHPKTGRLCLREHVENIHNID